MNDTREQRALRLSQTPLGLMAYADSLEELGAPERTVLYWRLTGA